MPRRSAPSSSLPPRPTPIPAKFWRACAGISAQAPVVNSRVYYFPQGHIDQAASQPRNLSPLVYSRPVIPCRVAAVNYFADPNTDEVFLKILLLPVTDGSAQDFLPPAVAAEGNSGNGNGDDEEVASYAKILTRSDANNGGGFSVPRSCADLVFPPLNFEEDPPVQNLRITDLHGAVWEFRHIHRGTPRRHLFTSGWSKFVNSKKIISGDTVVFMKDSHGRMFVGLRRNMSLDDDISDGGLDWCEAIVGMDEGKEEKEEKEEEEEVMTEGFARNGKGRVSSTSVAEAMELAAQNKPFEVVYYPSVGWGEFVVKAEDVDAMINGIPWSVGMRVKMGRENYDSSRMDWFQGTVSGVTVPGKDQPWSGSPWRMLQITWDESEILKNVNSVSPWQVELLSETFLLPQMFPPTKRFRTTDGSGVFTNEMGESSSSISRFSIPDSTMGLLNQTLLSNYDTLFSPSMQGARHPLFSAVTHPLFSIDPSLSIDSSFENNIVPKLNVMLPKLNIDTHKPKNLSPQSKFSSTPIDETPNSNSTKSGASSFQLFGCTIQTDKVSDKIDDHNNVEGEDNIQ